MKYALKLFNTAVFCAILAFNQVSVFADTKGTVVEEDVAVKGESNEDSETVGNLSLGETVEVLNVENGFYKVALEGVEKAFVLDKYVSVFEAEAVVVGDDVVVRSEPNSESTKLGGLNYGETVTVNGVDGDYYRIKFNGSDCFVHSDYIVGDMIYSVQRIEGASNPDGYTTYGTIIVDTSANLRTEASEEAEVLKTLSQNYVVDVVEVLDGWVKVSTGEEEGYVNSSYIVVQRGIKPEQPEEIIEQEIQAYQNSRADEIIAYAEQFMGTPYVWGGTSLTSGVDCSGFTYSVMRDNGIYLNRTSRDQYNNGYRVSKSELQKGDLVFFDTTGANNGGISHVGIYIGDGTFIHSSSGKQWGITKNNLGEAYYQRTWVGATRVL